ncbi:MAG: GGDEF domain-containing protein [Proteobacteria bacterium]|nr:GGDEF domain-containing protein [Pseudomonadota bacterium]
MTRTRARWLAFAACLLPVVAQANDSAESASYPRATAVATMQAIAARIEHTYAVFAPAFVGALPPLARAGFERKMALLQSVFNAQKLADTHAARAQAWLMRAGAVHEAGEVITLRAENALVNGDYTLVQQLADQLQEFATSSGSERLAMYAVLYRGQLDRHHGDLDAATQREQSALDMARALHDDAVTARALTYLGNIHRDRGEYAQALDLQLQAIAIDERLGRRVAITYRNLAQLYRDLDDPESAQAYFEKAIAAATRNGNPSRYAEVYGSYAGFLNDTLDHARALSLAREALALDEVLGDTPGTAFEQLEIGRALLGLNRTTEAVAPLQIALGMGRALGQQEIIARSLLALAKAALDLGDRAAARARLQEAIQKLDSNRFKPRLVQAYDLGEQLAVVDGDSALALRYASKRGALREELIGAAASRRLAAMETRHARAEAEQQLVLARKENQLQAARLRQQLQQRYFGIALLATLLTLAVILAWRFTNTRRLNRALSTRNTQIETQRSALSDANRRLKQQAGALYQAAITDPLTGVCNRGHLMQELNARFSDSLRNDAELAILLIDFDHFKQVNDVHGHQFGDRILVAGVLALRHGLKHTDLIGRYGGEEFIVVIGDPDAANAEQIAERLRTRVAETLLPLLPRDARATTVSIGIALLSRLPAPVRLEALIEAADKAVYAAKSAGRNRVAVHSG